MWKIDSREATVIIGRGLDFLVERTSDGQLSAPAWTVQLAREEILSWTAPQDGTDWSAIWSAAIADEWIDRTPLILWLAERRERRGTVCPCKSAAA